MRRFCSRPLLPLSFLLFFAPLAIAQQLNVGKLLIATSKSHDPDLARSVILLIHYDNDGAIGLILNRRVRDAYFGGPVPLGVRCLFRSVKEPIDAEHLLADVYLATHPVKKGRVYAGYTGWSNQQLKDEVFRGLWKILDGDAAVIFDPKPTTLWPRLLR
jgi:putative transcriptional regulator